MSAIRGAQDDLISAAQDALDAGFTARDVHDIVEDAIQVHLEEQDDDDDEVVAAAVVVFGD